MTCKVHARTAHLMHFMLPLLHLACGGTWDVRLNGLWCIGPSYRGCHRYNVQHIMVCDDVFDRPFECCLAVIAVVYGHNNLACRRSSGFWHQVRALLMKRPHVVNIEARASAFRNATLIKNLTDNSVDLVTPICWVPHLRQMKFKDHTLASTFSTHHPYVCLRMGLRMLTVARRLA